MEFPRNEKLQFVKVSDPTMLRAVLQERHPISCLMQNQVLLFEKFKDELTFFTIGEEINSNSWIVSSNTRADYRCTYSISAPSPIVQGHQEVPAEVRECFLNGGLINWQEFSPVLLFTPMPIPVSNMIFDISVNLNGNVTEIHPCYFFYMTRESALQLETRSENPDVEIRRFDVTKNEQEFFLKTWKYALPGSEKVFPNCLSKNASGGVFINGKCVCGVYIPAIGFLSALHTLKDYRNKGYAKLTMKYAFKEYAEDGHIPCLAVERPNKSSIKFYENLGLQRAGCVNYIIVQSRNVNTNI